MAQSRSRAAVRTVLRIACDLLRLVSATVRSHVQLAAENLFLRKQLALYVERQVKPRRADDATRIALVALSWLIDCRRILEHFQLVLSTGAWYSWRPGGAHGRGVLDGFA
jgi:hypothetical protein